MPFLPPPPPPGPPPPPSFSLNSKESSKPSGGDGRDLLLQSIRQGAKLKKAVTNDRSTPFVSAKVGTSTSTSSKNNTSSGNNEIKSNGVPGGGLGGLFAGGIPKLKPTGRGIGGGSPATSTSSSGSDQMSNSIPQQQEVNRRPFPADLKNRGPPPQPPPSNQKPNLSASVSDSTLSNTSPGSLGKRGNNPPVPTKPAVTSYGKPNLAPKPPGTGIPRPPPPSAKPSPPAKSPGALNQPPSLPSRPPSVTRTQSMRAPRSPGPIPSPELGDFRGPRFQSQDALHCVSSAGPPPAPSFPPPPRTSTLPSNLNGLQQANGVQHIKGAAPPPPPSVPPAAMLGHRTAPAPPPQYARPGPIRAPLARPPPPPSRSVNPPLCPPPPPPTTAPPPPPHRTSPAPPPPKQTKLPVNAPLAPSGAPPPPPVRNSSMRNGSQSAADFEARYAEYFHSVKEFPLPERYTNCLKVYNSKSGSRRNVSRMPDMNAKQPAPQPPPLTHLQIGNKMWANETSIC